MFRWAVIGTGIIANKVLQEVVDSGRHSVVAAFSRTRAKTEAFCQKFGAKVYDSAEEMLADTNIDAVYIATPHSEHYRYAKLCISCGKPVLVEKALTVNALQTAELLRLSAEAGVYFSEAMWMRFSPVAQTVKTWVDCGAVGEVQKIVANFSFNLHIGQSTDRVNLKKYAGGALLDVGVYTVSLCQFLLGKPANILCTQTYLDSGVDSTSKIELGYPNGAVCELKCGINGAIQNTATIIGSKGKIALPLFFAMPKATLKAKGIRGTTKAKIGYIYEFDKVAKDILAGQIESSEITHADSLAVMKILDECRKINHYDFPAEIEAL